MELLLLDVIYCKSGTFYSSLLAESLKLVPVDASLSMIILVHETEDSSDAGLLESLDIQLTRRMCSDADSGITDLGEE